MGKVGQKLTKIKAGVKPETKKVKKPTRAQLIKKLDVAWSEFVRYRDKCCQKCGSQSRSMSAHHAFGRRHMATRWDIFNGVLLCFPCHIRWAHRDPAGFSVWFRDHVGSAQYERLAETHNIPTKHTTDDLNRMIEELNKNVPVYKSVCEYCNCPTLKTVKIKNPEL